MKLITYHSKIGVKIPSLEHWKGWTDLAVVAGKAINNGRRESRRSKMMPHLFFPEYDVSIYSDRPIVNDPRPMVEKYLRGSDWAAVEGWDTIPDAYKAIEFLLLRCQFGASDREIKGDLILQYHRYREERLPKDSGFWTCGLIIRRHTPETNRIGEAWYREYMNASERDQASFPYIRWKHGLKIATISTKDRNKLWNAQKQVL